MTLDREYLSLSNFVPYLMFCFRILRKVHLNYSYCSIRLLRNFSQNIGESVGYAKPYVDRIITFEYDIVYWFFIIYYTYAILSKIQIRNF